MSQDPPIKTCTKCGQPFPATAEYFRRHRKGRFGLRPECKSCSCPNTPNPDKARLQKRKWRNSNPEKSRNASKNWRLHNRERVREYEKSYRGNHSIQDRAKTERRRALKSSAAGSYSSADVQMQLLMQSGLCWWCGKTLDKFHIDHRVPLSRRGSNSPENICITCPVCNLSKGRKLPPEWTDRLL